MKKTTLFRILLCMLSLMLFATAFVGCKKSGQVTTETDTKSAEKETTVGDDGEYDVNGYLKDSLPTLDYNMESIKILYWNSEVTEFYVADDEKEASVIDSAVWARNAYVEQRLNVVLDYIKEYGDVGNINTFRQRAENAANTDEPFDILTAHTRTMATCAINGLLADLAAVENSYFDFDAPWWNQTIQDKIEIDGAFYFTTGDIAPSLVQMIYCVYFNANTIRALELESPYDMVENNEWTLENMMTMTENYYQDLNNNVQKDKDDLLPLAGQDFDWPAFLHGCGIEYIVKDDTGERIVDPNLKGELGISIMEQLQDWVSLDNCFVATGNANIVTPFVNGNIMFLITQSGRAAMSFSEISFEYGCVPMPKYNSEQENYICAGRQPISMFGIQRAADKSRRSMISAVMEAWASEGYRAVTPVVFETVMQYRKSTSSQMMKMLELIRDSAWFDIGRMYSESLNKWVDKPGAYLASNKPWSNYISSDMPTTEAKLVEFIAAMRAVAEE